MSINTNRTPIIESMKNEEHKRSDFFHGYKVSPEQNQYKGYDDEVYFKNYDQAAEYASFMCLKYDTVFTIVGYADYEYCHSNGYIEWCTEEETLAIVSC